VCLLVSSVSRSHAYAVKVPATDRQTDRHTVRAAPGAVLALGPEAMWKARSGFSSTRTNLSPFTKDFRGGEHPEFTVFLEALLRRSITCLSKVKFVPCSPLCSSRSEEHTSELQSHLNLVWRL